MSRVISSLDEIAGDYDLALVDLWGCLHDGIRPYPEAVEACRRFRARGGAVVLVTNAPRPRADVERQIAGIGVPADCWDTIATSGDSARAAMFRGTVGRRVWTIEGPGDHGFFAPMALIDDPVEIAEVPLAEAEGIVCLGPADPHADPAVYRPQFLVAKQRGLKLLCANPDIVVDRGGVREWCAGALAALYTEMGGESLYFGKPHPPIYDLARRRYAELPGALPEPRVLAIGDGIRTDILGAQQEDIDSLFITGGIAAEETKTEGQPDPDALAAFLAAEQVTPTFAIGYLR
ncbi:TIGR01459 family HAD-type hydrolase [Histidinibacterium lentulum]|uniref:TIGR01459 family HAD-type hydrolase n=1 Tax=Histidinibacterium lentulum TaxID=2480588 RepID=A0A3N2R549_9RHOB|nr:TIGR01459 family HAD-type hydrolase [Histidinibacterium lentulum]ROU02518.1 TIGR01459 family HAD-type hydrolase [Histidinibacterium lentulum]